MYGLNAHVWWAQGKKRIKRKEWGGVPLHSEIIVWKKVSITTFGSPFKMFSLTTFGMAFFFRTMISEWRGSPNEPCRLKKRGVPLQFKIIVWKRWLVSRRTRLNPVPSSPLPWNKVFFLTIISKWRGTPFFSFWRGNLFSLTTFSLRGPCRRSLNTVCSLFPFARTHSRDATFDFPPRWALHTHSHRALGQKRPFIIRPLPF